jgi:hypothetical protein
VIHQTLSGAAKAVAGTGSEAGWDFWGAPSGAGGFVPLTTLRERPRENGAAKPAARAAEPPAKAEPTGNRTPPPAASEASGLTAIAQARPELFPLKIQANYRGATVEATINAAGEIEYNGKTYKSPSAAANHARLDHGFGGAARVRTNGWTWWRFTDTDGAVKVLDLLRHGTAARA